MTTKALHFFFQKIMVFTLLLISFFMGQVAYAAVGTFVETKVVYLFQKGKR